MKHVFFLVCFLVALVTPAHALLHLGEEPPPDLIVESNGLEWVWASPCRHQNFGNTCTSGVLEHHGFMAPEEADWLQSFSSHVQVVHHFDFVVFNVPVKKCAAAYFDMSWDHCDSANLSFAEMGPNYPFAQGYSEIGDTFLVRNIIQQSDVDLPLPSTLLLFGIGILGWTTFKRRVCGDL